MSRENQNRDHDGNYLSEEELEKLIAEVETNSMLHAPHNLKDEILQAAEQEQSDLSVKKEIVKKRPAAYQKSRRRAFFLYVLEVEAVSAAAIAMLFLTPVRNADSWTSQKVQDPTSSVMYQINEKSNAFCSHLYDFSNRMIMTDSEK